jgi:hypothetical protein
LEIDMPEKYQRLLQPDFVLPSQFFAVPRGGTRTVPGECRLLLAVLLEAVNCFKTHAGATDNRGRRLYREAEDWIMREDARSGGDARLSFAYVCEVLDLDPGFLRQGLRRWRQAYLASALRPRARVTA